MAQLAILPDGGSGFWIQVGYNGGMEMLDTLEQEGIAPEDYGLLMLPRGNTTTRHRRECGGCEDMTDRQRLELRQSEVRSRLSELAGDEGDDASSEIETLTREYRTNEAKIRAIMVTEDVPPIRTAWRRASAAACSTRSDVGELVYNLVNGRSGVDGAMAELQKEYELGSNEIHIRQLRQDVETRAR